MAHRLVFSHSPTREQRKHQAREFDLLGSEDPAESNPAAARIVLALLAPDVSETILQQQLDRRIMRALTSGRQASRLGFSLVLTNILKALFGEANLAQTRFPHLGFVEILQLLTKNTKASGGSTSGQEDRDILFGRLFGLYAFIESRVLFPDITRWHVVLRLILDLYHTKAWIRPVCGRHILDAMKQMDREQAIDTLKKLDDPNIAKENFIKTPEGVAIWVFAQTRFPGLKVKYWQAPFNPSTIGDLVPVLRESYQNSSPDTMGHRQQIKLAGWNPILHPAWSVILEYFANAGQTELRVFRRFWIRVIDDSLFSKRATEGQKYKGFLVFQKMLQGFADRHLHAHAEALFSKNFMSCLMNQVSRKDNSLHKAATKALTTTELTISNHKPALIPVLKGLIYKNGVYNFDEKTKTKTIHNLLKHTSEATAKTIINVISKPLPAAGKPAKHETPVILRTYIRYLSTIANACSSPEKLPFREGTFYNAMLELAQLAYYRAPGIPPDILTENVREMCRTALATVLAKASGRPESCDSVCHVVSSLDIRSVLMSEEVRTDVQEALSRMAKLCEHSKTDDTNKGLFRSVAMLHAITVVRAYNAEHDVIGDLALLRQHSGAWEQGEFANGEAETSTVFIEMLLSMVTRPSYLMRQVSRHVFGAFTPHISAAGLKHLTDPLTCGEDLEGENEFFQHSDEEMEFDEDEEEDELDADVEFVNIEEMNDEHGEEDAEDEDEDGDGPESEGEFDRPEDLDNELEKILNSHRLDKTLDAASSESEDNMSDSEMLAIDDQLAAAMRPYIQDHSNKPKELKKKAMLRVLNLKNRVLDYLDIYVRNEPCNALSFSLLLPLLQCLRTTGSKSLSERASKIICNYRKHQKKAISNFRKSQRQATTSDAQEVQILEPDDMLKLIREIHDSAPKNDSRAYAKAASSASIIVVSALIATDKTKIADVVQIYGRTQADCFSQDNKLHLSFWTEWDDWYRNAVQQARN